MRQQRSVITRIKHRWWRTSRLLLQASVANLLMAAGAPAATETVPDPPVQRTFAELGSPALELRGTQPSGTVNIGVRGDEAVIAAKLRLRLTYSPAMLPQLSHLRVSLNGQVLAALPLPAAQAGREIEREVVLDPRYFSDYNQVRFDLIGHYSMECEDPRHSSLWATLSASSELELSLQRLGLRNDLGLLPAPFFDTRDGRRLSVSLVLPERPSWEIVRIAGIAASWFGLLADYRGARFPVSYATLPPQHAVVFATNSSRPSQLALAEVTAPTVSIVDHPADPLLKLLVFQGKDEEQLRLAVTGVVLGNPALSGTKATVAAVSSQKRVAYDAPRWLRTDRAVKLGELVDSPQQLQTNGMAPAPIRINLRLPPDLFTWNQAGVPLDLRYRYSAPSETDNASLSVSVNEQLLRSYHLRAESQGGPGAKLLVPLLQGGAVQDSEEVLIPAFQLASNNQLQLRFAIDPQRTGPCSDLSGEQLRQAIDPDSSIDLSDFPHYTAMPNLALFANAGYPFTRYADLAESAIVLPDTADAKLLEQLFFMLGRMGRQTGAVATSYQLLDAEQARDAKNLDLLVLTGEASNKLLASWKQDPLLVLTGGDRTFKEQRPAPGYAQPRDKATAPASTREVRLNANGSLAAFISFESPLSGDRTVVALAGTDSEAAESLIATLEDDGKVPLIRGDLAVVRAGTVQSFQSDSIYYVGSLSLWKRLWFHLSQHVILLTVVALGVVVLVALLLYGGLQRRVARRLADVKAQ